MNISFVASHGEFVSDTRKVVVSTDNSESFENLRFGEFLSLQNVLIFNF